MQRVAPWAWVAVLGTALSLSRWSLDSLLRHYGVPGVLAAVVSATFDEAAPVAADLALRRAVKGHSTTGVQLLMLSAVGLSAWLNYEHGQLLGYPVAMRVLFATPAVIAGWLFELQLGGVYEDRMHELGKTGRPLPRLGSWSGSSIRGQRSDGDAFGAAIRRTGIGARRKRTRLRPRLFPSWRRPVTPNHFNRKVI